MPAHRTGFALPLDELRDEIDRLWTTLVAAPPLHGWGPRPGPGGFPAVNLRETDVAFIVEAELPGLDAADLDISVSGDELVLKGARSGGTDAAPDTAPSPAGECCGGGCATSDAAGRSSPKVVWHLRERGAGSFERRLTLPMAVDARAVEASLVDGVLTVTCPKLAECQPRKVNVRAG